MYLDVNQGNDQFHMQFIDFNLRKKKISREKKCREKNELNKGWLPYQLDLFHAGGDKIPKCMVSVAVP